MIGLMHDRVAQYLREGLTNQGFVFISSSIAERQRPDLFPPGQGFTTGGYFSQSWSHIDALLSSLGCDNVFSARVEGQSDPVRLAAYDAGDLERRIQRHTGLSVRIVKPAASDSAGASERQDVGAFLADLAVQLAFEDAVGRDGEAGPPGWPCPARRKWFDERNLVDPLYGGLGKRS